MTQSRKFFKDGIRFECTRCGHCCTGEPGSIFVNSGEIQNIREYLGMEEAAFEQGCLRPMPGGFSIREKENGDCIFYTEGGCSIHDLRPVQCRTYPFWFSTMRSEEQWLKTCAECPGIGQGRLYTQEEILKTVHRDMARELTEEEYHGS